MLIVPFFANGPDGEWCAPSKFMILVEPEFGQPVGQNRKIVVRHFEDVVCGINGAKEIQEIPNVRAFYHGAITEPRKRCMNHRTGLDRTGS